MSGLVIRSHLGLGDMLIINALVRDMSAEFSSVLLPCKQHNVPSVSFMLKDCENVTISPVLDDAGADKLVTGMCVEGAKVLKLGMFGAGRFNPFGWDGQMYSQAGVPFEWRWERFHAPSGFNNNLLPHLQGTVFAFVHDDPKRGFVILDSDLPKMAIVRPSPGLTDNIFDWRPLIEQAKEIHCIDSCFAILADSIPTSADRLVFHLGVRHGARPPTLKKQWEVIR